MLATIFAVIANVAFYEKGVLFPAIIAVSLYAIAGMLFVPLRSKPIARRTSLAGVILFLAGLFGAILLGLAATIFVFIGVPVYPPYIILPLALSFILMYISTD